MDGQLISWRDAKVRVLTHAMHYGSAVFEGDRRLWRRDLQIDQNIPTACAKSALYPRFRSSLYDNAQIDAAKALVLEKNGFADAYVRPIAWRGSEMMGVSAQHNTIHLAIATWEWPSYFDPAQRMKGIRLDFADYRRPDPATAPCRSKRRRPLYDLHDLQVQGRAQEATPTR